MHFYVLLFFAGVLNKGVKGEAGGSFFYSRLDKLGLKLDVRVSLAEFIMTKINKFSTEGSRGCDAIEHDFILGYCFSRENL